MTISKLTFEKINHSCSHYTSGIINPNHLLINYNNHHHYYNVLLFSANNLSLTYQLSQSKSGRVPSVLMEYPSNNPNYTRHTWRHRPELTYETV